MYRYMIRKWEDGTVLRRVAPRSYSVQTQDGGIYRRNRQDLKGVTSLEKVKTSMEKSATDPSDSKSRLYN